MAKMKLNPAVETLSGKLGDMIHRQLWGRHVVSHVPNFSNYVPSLKQCAQNNKYKAAGAIWGTLAPEVKAAYGAWGKELNRPPYALFNKNYAHPPTVEDIDLSGYTGQPNQIINVHAVDLFEVARVQVTVRAAGGNVIESGAALKVEGSKRQWIYRTTGTVEEPAGLTVEAVAVNWPGREGNRIEILHPA